MVFNNKQGCCSTPVEIKLNKAMNLKHNSITQMYELLLI